MADPGEGPGGPTPPLLLDKTEVRMVEKKILETAPPPPLSQDQDDPSPLRHTSVTAWAWVYSYFEKGCRKKYARNNLER